MIWKPASGFGRGVQGGGNRDDRVADGRGFVERGRGRGRSPRIADGIGQRDAVGQRAAGQRGNIDRVMSCVAEVTLPLPLTEPAPPLLVTV